MSNLGLCWALYSQFFAQITKKPLRLNGVIFPQPCNAANLALESDHKLVPIVNDAAAVSTLCRCWCHNGHCWLGSVECVKKLLKHCVPSMQVPLWLKYMTFLTKFQLRPCCNTDGCWDPFSHGIPSSPCSFLMQSHSRDPKVKAWKISARSSFQIPFPTSTPPPGSN